MSDLYAIQTTTLTALGDAVRRHTGDVITKRIRVDKNNTGTAVFQSHNAFCLPNSTSSYGDKCSIKFELLDANLPSNAKLDITHVYWSGSTHYSNDIMDNKPFNEITFPYVIPNFTFETDAWLNFRLMGDIDTTHFIDFEITMTLLSETDKEPIRFTPLEMVEQLNNTPTVPMTSNELILIEDGSYFNYNGKWDWFIEKYGSKMLAHRITNLTRAFEYSKLSVIPFNFQFLPLNAGNSVVSCFASMKNLTEAPMLNGLCVANNSRLFENCESLTMVPDLYCQTWDWSFVNSQTSPYSSHGQMNGIFYNCKKLRKFPMTLFAGGNPVASNSSSCFYQQFYNCFMLDEIADMPNPHPQATWSSNAFYNFCDYCYRLKRLTFADMAWPSGLKNQTLDLTNNVGYGGKYFNGTPGYQVANDEDYQRLKNHSDWWTQDMAYSRYNHDSAVETIGSLPDLSSGSGNTIKFKGDAGSKTDGGAISTLTANEIAVAAAKGWTVSIA